MYWEQPLGVIPDARCQNCNRNFPARAAHSTGRIAAVRYRAAHEGSMAGGRETVSRAQAFLLEHDKDALDFVGNRTDCALLVLLRSWGISYEALREVRLAAHGSCQEAADHAHAAQSRKVLPLSRCDEGATAAC